MASATETMVGNDISIGKIIIMRGNDAGDIGRQGQERCTCMLCHSAMATLFDVNKRDLSTKYQLTLFSTFQNFVNKRSDD